MRGAFKLKSIVYHNHYYRILRYERNEWLISQLFRNNRYIYTYIILLHLIYVYLSRNIKSFRFYYNIVVIQIISYINLLLFSSSLPIHSCYNQNTHFAFYITLILMHLILCIFKYSCMFSVGVWLWIFIIFLYIPFYDVSPKWLNETLAPFWYSVV